MAKRHSTAAGKSTAPRTPTKRSQNDSGLGATTATPIADALTDEQIESVIDHFYQVETLLESIRTSAYLVTDCIPPEKGQVAPTAIDAMVTRAFESLEKGIDILDEVGLLGDERRPGAAAEVSHG